MLTGEGANGKSTLLNVLVALLGAENVTGLTLQDLSDNNFAASKLDCKYANICPDVPSSRIESSGKFKALTGGDLVFADRKNKEPIHFYNSAKLIFSANQLPKTRDESDAFMRRWVILNFPMKFTPATANINLTRELTAGDELSGIFNWAIEDLKPLLAKGAFQTDQQVEATREMYLRRSDSIAAFVLDTLEVGGADDFIDKDEVFNAYAAYCRKIKATVENKIGFGRDLPKHIVVSSQRRSVDGHAKTSVWVGVKPKTTDYFEKRDVCFEKRDVCFDEKVEPPENVKQTTL
jgi:putative DNA primase/helicase